MSDVKKPQAKPQAKRSEKLDQLVTITVDDSVEKIVQLDSKGQRIRFDSDPDLFKQLAPDEIAKLSDFGRYAYQIARDEWKERKDTQRQEEEDILEAIQTGTSMGRARQRLHIDGKQEGMEYMWARPDMLGDLLSKNRGWQKVSGGPERTLGNPTGRGPHVIANAGSEDVVLLKRPVKLGAAARRAKKNERQRRLKSMDQEQRSAIEREGVPSIGDEDRGLRWHDRTGAGEE